MRPKPELIFQKYSDQLSAPIVRKRYSMLDVLTLRDKIEGLHHTKGYIKNELNRINDLIKSAQQELTDAEMQNSKIKICPPGASGKRKGARMTEEMARGILEMLVEKGLVKREDIGE
uniref:Uncharacterized protein n=1 Tax=viral metagenome TaxID=1070528 RepID=A0A6M3X6A6_9ZZZZ